MISCSRNRARRQEYFSRKDSLNAAMTMGVPHPGLGGAMVQFEERGPGSGWGLQPASQPTALWQYPALSGMPMEPMILGPSVGPASGMAGAMGPATGGTGGYQIVRDPASGAVLLIAEAPTVLWGPPPVPQPPPQPVLLPPPSLQLLSGELHTLHHHTTRLLTLAPAPQPTTTQTPPLQERRHHKPLQAFVKLEPELEKSQQQPPPQQTYMTEPVAPVLATHVFYQPQTNYLQLNAQTDPSSVPLIQQQVCKSRATSPSAYHSPQPEVVAAHRDASNQTDDDDDNYYPNRAEENFSACVGVANNMEDSIDSTIENESLTRDVATGVSPAQAERDDTSVSDMFIDSEANTQSSNSLAETRSVDVSGLELLSNSIEQFETKTVNPNNIAEIIPKIIPPVKPIENDPPVECNAYEFKQETENRTFDGLGLLSAIAEQRFMEEVEENDVVKNPTTSESSSDPPTPPMKIVLSRRSSFDRDISASKFEKIRRRQEEKQSGEYKFPRDDREKRKAHEKKDREDRHSKDRKRKKQERRSKEEKRMRKERRKNRHEKRNPDEETFRSANATPVPSGELLESYKRVAGCKCDAENCSHVPSAEQLVVAIEKDMRARLELLQKACDERKRQLDELQPPDQDSSETESQPCSTKKRKVGRPKKVSSPDSTETIVAKKSKSKKGLVSYLLAAKAAANTSRVRPKLKAEPKVKHQSEEEEDSIEPSNSDDSDSDQKEQNDVKCSKNPQEPQIPRCTLTEELIDMGPRVLTAMGGLFYAGKLTAIQAPDVYAVTLDGERGNKPHILSREETLRDTILEVTPTSVSELPPGTRLCAYWSQQYRCLYPGTVAETSDTEDNFVPVEFDDGDSGRISIEDIRLLEPNYPVVEYDPNPLLTLGKRRRRTSALSMEERRKSVTEMKSIIPEVNQGTSENIISSSDDRHKKKSKKRHRERSDEEHKKKKKKHKCCDERCKHRRHKKHKRKHHKKRKHREEESSNAATAGEEEPALKDSGIGLSVEEPNPDNESEIQDDEPAGETVKNKCDNESANSSMCTIPSGFLPGSAIWRWRGSPRRARARGRRMHYKGIQRGLESISIGDAAVFLSTGRPDRPYIGRVIALWAGRSSSMVVRVKWFYHPEETVGCPQSLLYPGGLFESPHTDENDVQTISHKCEVLPVQEYKTWLEQEPHRAAAVYYNNDVYYLAGKYDPTLKVLSLEPNVPLANSTASRASKNS